MMVIRDEVTKGTGRVRARKENANGKKRDSEEGEGSTRTSC
jgi:hypothetical protein